MFWRFSPWQAPTPLWLQLRSGSSTMEARNMGSSDLMSPAYPRMWAKFCLRRELKLLTGDSAKLPQYVLVCAVGAAPHYQSRHTDVDQLTAPPICTKHGATSATTRLKNCSLKVFWYCLAHIRYLCICKSNSNVSASSAMKVTAYHCLFAFWNVSQNGMDNYAIRLTI